MKLVPIASSSSGNCIYVGDNDTHILVDIGISGKKAEAGLKCLDLTGEDIDAILITHEHVDHIGGLGIFSRRYNVPIYATAATIEAIRNNAKLGSIEKDLFNTIKADDPFCIKGIEIEAFNTYHDAAEPVAYHFKKNGKKVAIATDTGTYDDYMVKHLLDTNAILIESNHDIRMLQAGPYPYSTKQRILSDKGHLSNDLCSRLMIELLHDGLEGIILGHLSKENNYPQLAFETLRTEIQMSSCPYKPGDFRIMVASPDEVTHSIELI